MKRYVGIVFIAVGCFVVAGCAPGYFVIDRYPVSETPGFSVDLDEVREIAAAGDGELPTEVRSLVVTELALPAWFIMAGGGCEKVPFDFVAYQVVYPDGTIIIDSCSDKNAYDRIPAPVRSLFFRSFNEKNYDHLQQSLRTAKLVLVTHEHADHIGGIAASPYLSEILPHLLLTTEQYESARMGEAGFSEGALNGYTPVSYDRYYAAAPGIVLIKAPGHATGQQIIYVLTKDGNEYLFLGDIIWNRANLKHRVYRPLLVSLAIKEDVDCAREEFRWVLDTLYDNPNSRVIYVISHDRDQLRDYIDAGVITEGFR
jgi:glyoxylase-like metal-dependent hydrolase (beta-lactamase superfamily II)